MNNETCFSDDLTSISPSFANRQRKADIVSAFAIIFKLSIAQDKLRSLVQEWGNEPLGQDPGIQLTLPDGATTAPLVQESHESITSLGIYLDDDNSGATQFATTLRYIVNTLGRVRRVRGNPHLKILVLRPAFFPSLAYRLQHMTWPLAIYDKLASCVNSFLYKTLKLYIGFPKSLLQLPTHLGGFGIPDLCAHVQKTKFSIICRIYAGTHRCGTVSTVYLRGLTQSMGQRYNQAPRSSYLSLPSPRYNYLPHFGPPVYFNSYRNITSNSLEEGRK